ncbi:MerR family transcriptional regulator [Paenibacillus amylolyticus]|uniref:helix-turn-helix domain-containing protein n=2 Tax=Paenibacillus TaxID=44249 RepID=UPI001F0ED130|nr:MerR family transcriptional regulator [Paenibacillus amylolyticus]
MQEEVKVGMTVNAEITISELAKLMHVSVHQIRYFEEKGVLHPAYTADNQYRMYGMDEVYRLAHILLLRKMGLSVQVIKECLTRLTPEEITLLFHQALTDTEAEIKKLQETKHFMEKLLEEKAHLADPVETAYNIIQREATPLSLWFEMEATATLNAQTLVQHKGKITNLFEADLHYVYDSSGLVGMYTPTQEGMHHLMLPAGTYLSCHLFVENEEQLVAHIQHFYANAEEVGYVCQGPLLMVEKSYLSLFTPDKLHYELLSQITTEQEVAL